MFNHCGARFLDLMRLMVCHPALAGTLVRDSSSRKAETPVWPPSDTANAQYDSAQQAPARCNVVPGTEHQTCSPQRVIFCPGSMPAPPIRRRDLPRHVLH